MDCNGTMETIAGDSRDPCSAGESKRVLILGGGFGGVYAALRLEKSLARHDNLEVTLVTRDNYFLFTPMLPEVAAADLEQSTIVNPLRRLLKRVKSFVGSIDAIDLATRRVTVSSIPVLRSRLSETRSPFAINSSPIWKKPTPNARPASASLCLPSSWRAVDLPVSRRSVVSTTSCARRFGFIRICTQIIFVSSSSHPTR